MQASKATLKLVDDEVISSTLSPGTINMRLTRAVLGWKTGSRGEPKFRGPCSARGGLGRTGFGSNVEFERG